MADNFSSFNQFTTPFGVKRTPKNVSELNTIFSVSPHVSNYIFRELNARRLGTTELPRELSLYLSKLQEYWVLDGREAVRRTYLDPWINFAIIATGSNRLVISAEEWIMDNGNNIHGSADYLVGEKDMGGHVLWAPSLILEAKRMETLSAPAEKYNGVGQLSATMYAAKDSRGYEGSLRGFVSDGRFWRFIEMDERSMLVSMTDLLDAGAPSTWSVGKWYSAKEVWHILVDFFANFNRDVLRLPELLGHI